MKEFKIKLYSFDELSESAKAMICDKERENVYGNYGAMAQENDAHDRLDTLNKFCEVFNITYRIDYDHQYRFIVWQFKDVDMNGYEWCADDIKGKYLWRYLNRFYYQMCSRKWYYVDCDREKNNGKSYKERYSRIQWEKGTCPFTGMCFDCDILDKIFEWYEKPNWEITLHDLFDDVFHHYMKLWERDDDFHMSDEYIGEMISTNDSEKLYYENGVEFEGSADELEEYSSLSDAD